MQTPFSQFRSTHTSSQLPSLLKYPSSHTGEARVKTKQCHLSREVILKIEASLKIKSRNLEHRRWNNLPSSKRRRKPIEAGPTTTSSRRAILQSLWALVQITPSAKFRRGRNQTLTRWSLVARHKKMKNFWKSTADSKTQGIQIKTQFLSLKRNKTSAQPPRASQSHQSQFLNQWILLIPLHSHITAVTPSRCIQMQLRNSHLLLKQDCHPQIRTRWTKTAGSQFLTSAGSSTPTSFQWLMAMVWTEKKWVGIWKWSCPSILTPKSDTCLKNTLRIYRSIRRTNFLTLTKCVSRSITHSWIATRSSLPGPLISDSAARLASQSWLSVKSYSVQMLEIAEE